VELVAIQLVGAGLRESMLPQSGVASTAATKQTSRKAYFGEQGWLETPVVGRGDLRSGRLGPFIVEEYDATCLVPPGARAELDASGNIVVEL
jgi:N-methylhydantoinase A